MTLPDPPDPTDATECRPLARRRIAIFEHRELDRLGHMIEAAGAETLRCPLVAIADMPDGAPALAWIERFVATPPDDLALMTGEGLRRLNAAAERAGIAAAFLAALGRVRTITRGPKPARALSEIGLKPDLRAAQPTMAGIIATLSAEDLSGRRIALQLYPDAPTTLVDFLAAAGARPDPVWPYCYVAASGDEAIAALVKEAAAGRIDAVAFTSAAQVARLFEAARALGIEACLRTALRDTRVAAVGPVVAAELERHGLAVAIMPHGSYFMKPLISALVAAL